MAERSAFAALIDIFTAPSEAFAAIKERPRPWLPLLLVIVVYGVVSFTYVNAIDLPWFFDRAMQNAPNLTEAQRAQAVENQANMSPNLLGAFASVSAAVGFPVVLAIVALYFTGVSAALSAGIRFKQWFGLLAWCAMPVLLGLVASIANVLFSDARFMPQEELNPLAFGNLLGIDSEGAPFTQRVLLSLDVTVIWCLVLQVLGFQAWTGRSTLAAAAAVLAPVLLIFVVVGAFV